jgi:hypothetical protein
MPVSLEELENKITINFEKRLFINTKAINYVVQEYNTNIEGKSTLA